ncbi:MAG: T9SS type A sorting domain-containing protein [Candidatus Eisenbacteria bacterium]|nr:T9SS type A sorting domain-containing protein [Candidatus Eisenbacteria bacterium]
MTFTLQLKAAAPWRGLAALLLPILLTAGISSPVAADGHVDVIAGDAGEVRLVCRWTPEDVSIAAGVVRLAGCDLRGGRGEPLLPARTLRVALPPGTAASGVRVESLREVELPGRHPVAPARGALPIDGEGTRSDIDPDPQIYSSADPWPGRQASLLGGADLAGLSLASVRLSPIRWIPAEGRLFLAEEMTVVIECGPAGAPGDLLPAGLSESRLRDLETTIRRLAANPEEARLPAAPPIGRVLRALPSGSYDHVILTQESWVDDWKPLLDWRNRCGVRAAAVAIEWVLGEAGYAGTDVEKVRAFVADAHQNWGTRSFLFAGDSNVIPYHVRVITIPYETIDIPNDTYYADYDGDWICEVEIGRAPVRNLTHIATFLDKQFTYEKNPPSPGYVKTAAFFGFDIATCGDTYGERQKGEVDSLHLPASWTLSTEYDSETGSHRADVLALLEQGFHLVNHHDHCNTEFMGTGWICHAEGFGNAEVEALTNGDRLGIAHTVGCYPCNFPVRTCIAEAYLRNPNGGGVAFLGNTRTGFGGDIPDPDLFSARQDRYVYRNLFDYGIARLGENFTLAKNDEYDPDDPDSVHAYCFLQYHLLGDPETPVWTEEPAALAVTHPETLSVGAPSPFSVTVTSGGSPAEGALVCLWKGDEIYERETTSGGIASFTVTPAEAGTLLVTATLGNHVPWEGEALCVLSTGTAGPASGAPARTALLGAEPNPFNPSTTIRFSLAEREEVSLRVFDTRGRLVRTLSDRILPAGIHTVRWDGRDASGAPVPSGVYFIRMDAGSFTDRRKAVLIH